jgi:omega-amidase
MRVHILQMDTVWEDKAENRRRIAAALDAALGREPGHAAGYPPGSAGNSAAPLVLLPEMSLTGFTMDADAHGDMAAADADREFFAALAARHSAALVAGYADVPDTIELQAARNLAGAWGPDGARLAEYQKNYPFSLSGEDMAYAAGSETASFETGGMSFALAICYDLRFPELFRRQAGQVDGYIVIANWPAKRAEHWRTLLRARAIENQAWVIGVNRIGVDGYGVEYSGDSVIIDPFGGILAEAGSGEPVLSADIDPDRVAEVRERYPFLADRKSGN